MAGIDEHRVDVDKLATELENQIGTTDLSTPSEHCIFRVPKILRRHNPRAFEPNAFAIGPFHHRKKHLKATQKIKLTYLQSLLSRTPGTNQTEMLKLLTQSISEDLKFYRDCYADPINMSMDEFLKLLVLDGCFLVELFRKQEDCVLREENDPIFTMSCMLEFLLHDLILLENQIPWRVLLQVFDMTEDISGLSLVDLAIRFFLENSATGLTSQSAIKYRIKDIHENSSKHILDMLRNTMVLPFLSEEKTDIDLESSGGKALRSNSRIKNILDRLRKGKVLAFLGKERNTVPPQTEMVANIFIRQPNVSAATLEEAIPPDDFEKAIPSAATLEEAGISFKTPDRSESILRISFTIADGVLEIPRLHVSETTEPLFRNLISFEQCLPNCEGLVTSYAILMDKLINTTADMEVLCKSEVIDNWLSAEDTTVFFNQLYNDTFVKKYHYERLEENVNRYCCRCWPRYRRVLMHHYFKHPLFHFVLLSFYWLLPSYRLFLP